MKSKIVNSISSVLIISVAIIFAIGSTDEGVPTNAVDTALNQTVTTPTVDFTFTSAKTTRKVGSQFFKSTAVEGGIYVAVTYKYKNIGTKALSRRDEPKLTLYDAGGNAYKMDVGASGSLATETENDAKIISDLNPGLTANESGVWEVSEEFYQKGGWYIIVKAGDSIKLQLN